MSAGDGLVGATMGSGDDSLEIPPARIDHRRKISGGPGRDTLEVHGHGMTVDLAAGAMWERRRGSATDPAVRFGAFENAAITGSQGLTLIGDGGDNVLRAFGCNVKADGGAGDDALSVFPGLATGDVVPCAPTARDVHFDGGPGTTCCAGLGPDHLNGGVASHTADGRRGSDVCLPRSAATASADRPATPRLSRRCWNPLLREVAPPVGRRPDARRGYRGLTPR